MAVEEKKNRVVDTMPQVQKQQRRFEQVATRNHGKGDRQIKSQRLQQVHNGRDGNEICYEDV